MDQEMVDWARKAMELVDDAKRHDALVLFKHDDFNMIVTNAKEPEVIRRLGEALTNTNSDS